MILLKCKMCGGNIEASPDMTVGKCRYCGSTMTLPKIDTDKKAHLFNKANAYRMNNEFDKAYATYEVIVNEDPEEAEAYWGMILSEYGIEYVEDPTTHKRIPTCHRANPNLIVDSVNFAFAIQYADNERQLLYWNEAEEIDRLQSNILSVSAQVEPYAVFICYKETDDYTGERTYDSVIAQDIYEALSDKGVRTFFARISLEEVLGQNYEPYIYAALTSARIMIVVSTRREYLDAVWVKNEWMRFLQFMAVDKSKLIIPAFAEMTPHELPEELSRYQSQNMSKIGAIQELVYNIRKLLSYEEKEISTKANNRSSNTLNTTPYRAETRNRLKVPDLHRNKIIIGAGILAVVVTAIFIIVLAAQKKRISKASETSSHKETVSAQQASSKTTEEENMEIDTSDPLYIEGMKYLEAKQYSTAIASFRKIDENAEYKDYLIKKTYYEWAQREKDIGTAAVVERYEKAGDYKDAKEKKHEAMYEYLTRAKNGIINELQDKCAKELCAINYKDSKQLYEDIVKWRLVYCYVNNDKYSSEDLSVVPSNQPWYLNFNVSGGPYGGGDLRLDIEFSNGEVFSEKLNANNTHTYSNYRLWYSRYWNDPSTAPDVTVTAHLYDPNGNLLGTKSFEWKKM